ncbi:hypothetical protein C7S18_11675 [Ahniella affigens]|uniref:Uncharacterized protein n=1 Tax=Ahniella affigens TaxID=2021234 RepID=A0A2P1PSK5_9GAMM|nr:hypothetical protein [Ahniella affigens]AVP97815.1 hypothetical protein C7S18_11675 [Ahniella affigens]
MNTPHDQDFEALLKEYEAEFARYQKLPAAEPSRELDIAIMAKAREAVAKPKAKRSRWLVPLASVASLALAAGIGWRTIQGERRDQVAAIEQTAAKQDEVIVEFEWIDLPNRDAERKEMANSPPMPPAAAPLPAPAVAAPPPPPPPAEPPPIAETATSQPADLLADAATAPASDDGLARSSARAEREFAEPHVAQDHAVMAEPPESSNRAAGYTGGALSGPGQASPDNAPAPSKQDAKPKKILEPEEWIEQIRGLRSVRRFHEVKKELAEFKKTYPNYPLPSDLEKQGR